MLRTVRLTFLTFLAALASADLANAGFISVLMSAGPDGSSVPSS